MRISVKNKNKKYVKFQRKIKTHRRKQKRRFSRKKNYMKGRGFEETRNEMRTLLDNPESRRGRMLNTICGNDTYGACVDFGSYRELINNFFGNFNLKNNEVLQNLTKIKQIGNNSANGTIYELEFSKNNFTSYAVMKINQTNDSDSLLYEYYVGKTFINRYLNIFHVLLKHTACIK